MSQSKHYELNKQLLLEKKKNGCEDCGFNAHPAALQLDHIDPSTKHVTRTGLKQNPGAMVGYRTEIFLTEMAKCRVLCSNCHAIHTYEQSKVRRSKGEIKGRGMGRVRKMSDPHVRIAA
jgi:hypothetical protein